MVTDEEKAVLKKWRDDVHHGKYARAVVQSAIDDYIFSERTRLMLQRRLFDGIHFEKLADEFGLSPRQTKTIVYNAERILMRHVS